MRGSGGGKPGEGVVEPRVACENAPEKFNFVCLLCSEQAMGPRSSKLTYLHPIVNPRLARRKTLANLRRASWCKGRIAGANRREEEKVLRQFAIKKFVRCLT